MMADTRRLFGWMAVGAALALGLVLVLLVLRDDDQPAVPATSGGVVSRTAGAGPPPQKPVIPVPVVDRRPPPTPPPTTAPMVGIVTGRLVTPEHLPVPSGRIEALQGSSVAIPGLVALASLGLRTVVEADGRFTLSGVPPMSDLVLRVEGDETPLTELGPFLVQPSRTTDLGDLVVRAGLTITGTVFDERGVPVAGARIGLLQGPADSAAEERTERTMPEPVRLVLSNESGRFRIDHAAPESFVLMVSAKGFANALVPGGPGFNEQFAETDVPVIVRRAGVLRGRVLDREDDHPLAGAHVFAEPMDQGSGYSQAVTAADGHFVLENLVPGNYALSSTLKGYSPGHERSFDETPDADIVFHLDRQGSLTGMVLGSDGQPIRAFDLQPRFRNRRLDPAVPRGAFQRVTSADGSFVVDDLDPGFWSVDVWAKGYSLTSSEPLKVKQGEQAGRLTVTLLRGATLSGMVRDSEGLAVANAAVTLHANREPEVDFLRDVTPIPGVTQGTRTDAEGRFALEDLSARKYQVQVDHPDYAIVRRNDVALAAEQELELEAFVLQRAATVQGSALSGTGEVLAGVTVSLTAVDGFARQAVTDGRGQFVFTRVREGDYQLVCYGKQLSLGAMLASLKNPPETFRVAAGASLQRNAISLE